MTLISALACAVLLAPQGALAVFHGSPGGVGDVVIADPTLGQFPTVAPGLAGVQLLPIDTTGRIELDTFRTDVARLRTDVPTANRLLLPAGAGSLYRYSRAAAGAVDFGLMLIDANGQARSVFELQGVGLAFDEPPFQSRVAVSPNGAAVLVATTLAAGGDVIEIDLATGAQINRSANLAPQTFNLAGLHYKSGWGVFASDLGVYRFAAGSAGDAAPLTFASGTPPHLTGEIALSRNGQWAVTTGGLSPTQLDVYAFGATGDAVTVTSAPAVISPAGYLPDYSFGPYLAISDDGTRCAWRIETAVSREAFLGRVPVIAPTPTDQLTQDANFTDTIDEIGDFFFRPGSNVLVFAAGSGAVIGPPSIENLDFYSADLPASGASNLLNLTQSSGIANPPFVQAADLSPTLSVLDPTASRVLMYVGMSGGTGELIAADATGGGYTVLVPEVKNIDFVEYVGGEALVGLRRSNGSKPREIYHVAANGTPPAGPLLSVSTNNVFGRSEAGPNGLAAFIERTVQKERLWRFDATTGTLTKFSDRALFFGPALTFAAGGELGFTVGAGGVLSIYAAWPATAAVVRLPIPVSPGFILPGA